MNTHYENGRLSFDFAALLNSIPDEGKLALVDTLSCEDEIIRNVTAQILDGWTEQGSHGSLLCTAHSDPKPCNALDFARRQIALRAPEVAANEIKRLQDALAHVEKQLREYQEEQCRRRYHQ